MDDQQLSAWAAAIVAAAAVLSAATAPAQTAPAPAHAPGQVFRDCADCPQMTVIPPGSYLMGSPIDEPGRDNRESPQRRITFARAFAVGRFEVTRGEYAAFVRATGRTPRNRCSTHRANWALDEIGTWRDPGFAQGEDHPVVCIYRDDALAYVQWLNRRTPGGYRLLSEAEWEYAARAGTTTPFPWGYSANHGFANFGQDACCGGLAYGPDQWMYTSPVGSFPANAFGVFDMHGNVSELTEDCWQVSLDSVPSDGRAATNRSCSQRTVRGGLWWSDPAMARSARRGPNSHAYAADALGFRVARTLD